MLGARSALFRTGADAGAAIADEGILAGTSGGLVKKIRAAKADVGMKLRTLFANSPKANMTTVDIGQAVYGPIDEAITALKVEKNTAAISKLEDLFDGISDTIAANGGSLQAVTPKVAHDIRVFIDQTMKHGGADAIAASTKEVKKTIRRNISEIITAAVPESIPLNRRYSNLSAAEDAAWDKLNGSHGLAGALKLGGRIVGGGSLGYALGGSEGGRVGTGASFAAGTPLVGTAGAVGLSALGGKSGAALSKIVTAMVSQATRDLHDEALQEAQGDETVATQLMHGREAVYVAPDGTETRVPSGIVKATLNGDPSSENTPLAKWMTEMQKQKKIKPGGNLLFMER